MALTRNGRSVFQNPGSFQGVIGGHVGNFVKGGLRNRNAGGFDQTFSAYANGNLAPSTFILAQKSGSISSYTSAREFILGVASLTPAINLEASGNLVIVATNAKLDQIVSAVASGNISIASVSAILAGAAALDANGNITIVVTSAICGAIVSATAAANGAINGNGSPLTAQGFMIAVAGGATPLSPEGLAQAVWDYLKANPTVTGSMKEVLEKAKLSADNAFAVSS